MSLTLFLPKDPNSVMLNMFSFLFTLYSMITKAQNFRKKTRQRATRNMHQLSAEEKAISEKQKLLLCIVVVLRRPI